MRRFGQQVFDTSISGTTTVWYSPAQYDDLLGQADALAVMAVVEELFGTQFQLTFQIQHSANGRDWNVAESTTATAEGAYLVSRGFWPFLLGRVRLSASLSGNSPSCRLKLFATGREV